MAADQADICCWHYSDKRGRCRFKHGSVCEDWSAIQCAVYAVGGWTDGYSNTVFRLLTNLKGPRKGLVVPWRTNILTLGQPGPEIGFLQECLRWWDQWLKGRDTGIMEEPMLRAWMEYPVPPRTHLPEKPGRWVAEESWPAKSITDRHWHLEPGWLVESAAAAPGEVLTIRSPLSTGIASGSWCPYGVGHDQAADQRAEAGGSLVFDTGSLTKDMEILGAAIVELALSADRINAMVACTLSEIMPDGAVTRVTYGLLNLTHRESHENPTPLVPGKPYKVRVRLNEAGHRFGRATACAWPFRRPIGRSPGPRPRRRRYRSPADRAVFPCRSGPTRPRMRNWRLSPNPKAWRGLRKTTLRRQRKSG